MTVTVTTTMTRTMTLGELIAEAFDMAGSSEKSERVGARWAAESVVGALLETDNSSAAAMLGIRLGTDGDSVPEAV